MDEPIQMVRMRKPARCSCGEALDPGDRAGLIGGRGDPLCLRCLADIKAGRPRPRRRPGAAARRAQTAPGRAKQATTRPVRGGHRRRGTALTLAIAVVVAVGALYVQSSVLRDSGNSLASGVRIPGTDLVIGGDATRLSGGNSGNPRSLWPPVPSDASDHPLGSPPASASSSTEFVFMRTVDSADGTRPVAWDPCRPIHLVVNSAEAPAGADQLLHEATSRVSAATGLQFVFEGPTTETPSMDRQPEDFGRYGDRWSPVLVAWTDPSVIPRLEGSVAGLAGPVGAPFYTTDQAHWVSGTVNLDGPDIADVLNRPHGWDIARGIVMHELGHLVGLEHVPAPDELMYADATGLTHFGPGDLEGLRQLGLGPCFSN